MLLHTMKVWCLPPDLTEDELQRIFNDLLQVTIRFPLLLIHSREDVLILFPQDRMQWGLGSEILVELQVDRHLVGLERFADKLGEELRAALIANPTLSGTPIVKTNIYLGRGYSGITKRDTPRATSIVSIVDVDAH